MYSGPVSIQVNGGRQGDPRLPFLINRGRVLLGPMALHAGTRGALGVQKDRYIMDDGSYVDAIVSPYVNILAINLVTGGGEASEEEERWINKHPLSFVVANEDLDAVTGERLPGRPEILGDLNWRYHQAYHAVTHDSWANRSGGARTFIWDSDGRFPCGNMTWFHTVEVLQADGVTTEKVLRNVVSWQGPLNKAYSPLERTRKTPDVGTFIAVASASDDVPITMVFSSDPVYGAFIHQGHIAYINFNDTTDTITMRKTRGADASGFAVWDEEWSTVLPAEVGHLGTHFFANSDASECRAVGKSFVAGFSELVELPDNNQRYLPQCYASVEVIVDMATGVVTIGHRDKDDFPKYVATASDLVYDSTPTDKGKRFYFRDTVTPDQVAPTQTFNLYHAATGTTDRFPLPYVGEQYVTHSSHIFTVVSVTAVDPLLRVDQLTQRASDLELMTSETLAFNIRANDLVFTQFREEDKFGRSATVEVSWDYIAIDSGTGLPANIDPASVTTVINNTDRAYFRWHRKHYLWSEGKSLACVGYDKDDNVMRAFLEADQRTTFYMAMATGVGIHPPTLNEMEAEVDVVPSRYVKGDIGFEFSPTELVDYAPQDATPVGTVHTAYQNGILKDTNRMMIRVETEQGELSPVETFYRLVDYYAEFRDIRTASGYDPSTAPISWGAPWSSYNRTVENRKLYADAQGNYVEPVDIENVDTKNINLMVETEVEYFDMQGGVLLTTGTDDVEATLQETSTQSMPGNLYETDVLAGIPGSTGAGPPDFFGHRLLSASFGDDNFVQTGTLWSSTSARVADRDGEKAWGQYVDVDIQGVATSAGVATGAATFGVWGQRPNPGPINRQASIVVGVSMRSTQTMLFDAFGVAGVEQAVTTHWPAILPADAQNIFAQVGTAAWIFVNDFQYANAAVDYEGVRLASIPTEHKDEVPAASMTTTNAYLFGDTLDNLYGGFTPNPEADPPIDLDPYNLWLVAQGATADYPSEIFYGAKPVLRVKVD